MAQVFSENGTVWSAWGEAQSEVQLQVRRVSEKGAGRHGSSASSRRHRKRSGTGAGTRARPGQRPGPTVKQHDQEEVHRLMRLILAQGETIAGQLRRLREREAQIERLEAEAHRERVAQHGKDYVLAAYLRDTEEGEEIAKQSQDTPRTSRHLPGRPGGSMRPRQLVGEDDLSHFADESEAEQEAGASAMAVEPAAAAGSAGLASLPEAPLRTPVQPPEVGAGVDEEDLRAQIALWEKVVKVNKRLEQQEERLVRLYVGFRRSDPDGLAVDDRDQVRTSLARLQQVGVGGGGGGEADIEDGRRSLQANADLLTETEALLDAKRRLLRRLLAEMEAAELDTARLMAARDAARDATPADITPPSAHTMHTPIPMPCSSQLSQLPLPQSQPIKSHDNDSNSDTGLSSLHSSSEEGVYILDTLV
ncbi:Ras association domain-containing protein 9 [Frankliniella fusca]|uniref:Ras association domain-containing protein 9 n=1 Tax=Frankliniella fusca TaxID=407009 RepID=A0AAE1L8E5_9NEOP|nr:Ras association domain-containing protein 9 [Frankliniella fusca]